MKNKLRPEMTLGILLAAVWLLLKILPRTGLIMTLLLIVAAACMVLGLLPENLYRQAKDALNKLLKKK